MKIVAFPLSGTAYTNSFYTALENRGGNVIQGVFAGRWLLNNLAKNDVVHFHWPSLLYARQGNSKKLIRSFLRFVLLLSIISLKRVKIVWTAHNLLPHQACELPVLDIIARHIVIALAAHIYVHGEEAKMALATRFPRSWGKCVVIPCFWSRHTLQESRGPCKSISS